VVNTRPARNHSNLIARGLRGTLPESEPLPSAFCRALDKEGFAESRTQQSSAFGNELVYRVQDTRHRNTLGKYMFVECQTLGKGGARQKAVSGRPKADGR
jgi:hypothetical protein